MYISLASLNYYNIKHTYDDILMMFFYKVSYINKVKQIRKRMNFISHNYIYMQLFSLNFYDIERKK